MKQPNDKIQIEFALPVDCQEIAQLSKKLVESGLPGWRYTPAKVMSAIKNQSKNVVVARQGEIIAGFSIMSYADEKANLDLLGVKKQFRRCGIGKKLVYWLEEVAKTAGIFNLYVQVREENSEAVELYSVLGYEVIDIVNGYYSGRESAMLLYKNIASSKSGSSKI